jgi:ABC-type transport system involved in multi-copper enzyme maturation permease subunit
MRYFYFFCTYNPFICAGFMSHGQTKAFADAWIYCVISHLAVTAVLLFFSAMLVRRIARREGDATAAYTPPVPMPPTGADDALATAAAAKPGALAPGSSSATPGAEAPGLATAAQAPALPPPPLRTADLPPPPRVRANRDVSDNPVLWRELRRPLMVSLTQRVVGTTIILGLLVLTYGAAYANNALDDEESQIGYAFVFNALVMLVACVISATAIAQEKEGDTWTLLLASPLSGFQIVWAKALGAMRKMLWPMVLIVFHFAVFTVTGVIPVWAFILVVAVIVMFNSIWIASGIYLSLRCRKVTLAIIINLALPVIIYGVFSLVLAVVDEFMRWRGDLVEQVTWYLPFYYLGEGLNAADRHRGPSLPGSGNEQVSGEVFTAVAVFMGLLHLGVAVAILSWTAARFNEIVGRAPQWVPLPPPTPRRRPTELVTNLGVSGH